MDSHMARASKEESGGDTIEDGNRPVVAAKEAKKEGTGPSWHTERTGLTSNAN